MNKRAQLARSLTDSLSLSWPPIAVSFAATAPEGVPRVEGAVPAGCRFWEDAARGPFYTVTSDHEMCAVGVHTHNLAGASEKVAGELKKTLEVMTELDYVREDEVAALPTMERQFTHVVYAPLAEAPLPPDVVLMLADGRQGLLLTEAVARVDRGTPLALGRPACAALPQAIRSGKAVMSLGCCGARAYLDALESGVALWALPGQHLGDYAGTIETVARANETLGEFHRARRADVEAGRSPSLEESLARLS